MAWGFILLLGCQLAGEILVRLTELPIPGPVVGMVLLLLGIAFASRPGTDLSITANGLLSHLALLYIPAGVGLIAHLDLLAERAVALLLILFVSTALAIAVTAWIYQRLAKPVEATND